jgi:hypothetical protein
MRKSRRYICILLLSTASAFANVSVSSPGSGTTVGSPVRYVATSTASSCAKGVAAMGIYVNNQLMTVVNSASLSVGVPLSPGNYNTVVQEWDYCGGSTFTPVAITVANQTGVWVTAPANNSVVGSLVNYAATATTTACSKGVASMGVYVNNKLLYVVNGTALNTTLTLTPGSYNTVVEEWDYCGGAFYTPLSITVKGSSFSNVQASAGWEGYGQGPPNFIDCNPCGPQITWSMQQGIKSPSRDGMAAQFNIGGTGPYWDVLFTNHLIGDGSSQGLPDPGHALVPTLHNFAYDVYFYGSNVQLAEALEFDFNQFYNGLSFIWGHNCYLAGKNVWQLWDNVNSAWVSTNIPCNPVSNGWNHLTLQVERTPDNQLWYKSITLNGVTSNVNKYYPPGSAPGWYGITVNYQMDGNSQQSPYTIFLDNLTYYYW